MEDVSAVPVMVGTLKGASPVLEMWFQGSDKFQEQYQRSLQNSAVKTISERKHSDRPTGDKKRIFKMCL